MTGTSDQDMPDHYDIKRYEDRFRNEIISVWEKSVKSTHHFVLPSDLEYFKLLVNQIDFHSFDVYCLTLGDRVIGFIGTADRKIEMLFLDPDFIGQGFGAKLIMFALNELHADKVDVNEQNVHAVEFYSKFGFIKYDRLEKDDQGKDYPILKMKLDVKETDETLDNDNHSIL
jgi:putative acetyltransferase